MKTLVTLLGGACVVAASAQCVYAADVYGGQSYKDKPVETYVAPRSHGGLGLRVFLGYSAGDRDVSQRNSGEIGLRQTPECYEDGQPETASKSDSYERSCAELDEEATELANAFNAAGVDASWNGTTFELPLLRALSAMAGGEDISTLSGGVEAEYLVYSGNFAWGLVGGVTFYGDADSKTNYSGAPITLGGGALLSPHGSPQVGMDTGLTTSGYVAVERDFDIDLALKAGFLIRPDTLLYGIAGPSFAKGSIAGNVNIDGTNLGMTYQDDQWSVGYVIGAGVQHYLNNGWSINAQVDYKQHDWDASKSIDETIIAEGDSSLYGKASSKSEAEDSIWTVKLGVARHW